MASRLDARVVNRSRALIALSLVPFLVLTVIHWPIGPLLASSDYAQYILHAEALLHGRTYTDTGFIFSPNAPFAGPQAFPPGLPITLVPLLAAFGRNFAVLRIFQIVCAIVWLWCAARYLEKRTGIWIACGAVLMTGVALERAFATNVVNSDLGFAALVWALLLVADADGEWTPRRALITVVLGTAGMAYRVVGITLIPALLIYGVLRWRKGARLAIAPVVVWFALAGIALRTLPITSQYRETVLTNPERLPDRVSRNIPHAKVGVLEALLYPLPGDRANDVYHAVAALIVAIGAALYLRKYGVSVLTFFAFSYSAFLLIAPAAAQRYWWPLFPLLAAWLLLGVEQIARVVARNAVVVRRSPYAVAAVLSVSALLLSAARPRPVTLSDQADVNALFDAVRANTSTDSARIYFVNPRVLTLQTGRSAMPFIDLPGRELLSQLRTNWITHVVSGDLGSGRKAQSTLDAVIVQNPNLFLPVYRNGGFTLYRFARP